MFNIGLQIPSADRSPSELNRAKVLRLRSHCELVGFGGTLSEQLRCIRKLAVSFPVSQELPHRLSAHFSQKIPQSDFDARPGVRRLQQVHAVEFNLRRDSLNIFGAI